MPRMPRRIELDQDGCYHLRGQVTGPVEEEPLFSPPPYSLPTQFRHYRIRRPAPRNACRTFLRTSAATSMAAASRLVTASYPGPCLKYLIFAGNGSSLFSGFSPGHLTFFFVVSETRSL
jgi:hypothetical protein